MKMRLSLALFCLAVFTSVSVYADGSSPMIDISGIPGKPVLSDVSGLIGLPAGMTGEGLHELLAPLIADLRNVGTTWVGETSVGALGLSDDLTKKMHDLDGMIGSNIKQPIDSLGMDIRAAAGQIYSAAVRAQYIISNQRQCLALNATMVNSGLATVASQLKSAVPFTSTPSAWLGYFKFDTLATPFVVPETGGTLTIAGFNVWQDMPTEVVLVSEDRSKDLLKLLANRGASDNEVATSISADAIAAQAGKCPAIKVTTRHQKKFWFIPLGVETMENYLPLCISPAINTSLQVIGYQQGDYQQDVVRGNGSLRVFHFDNSSCEDRHNVSATIEWPLPATQRISNISVAIGGNERNQSNVQCSVISRNAVRCAGWLDTATCSPGILGATLFHSTVAEKVVTPEITENTTAHDASSGISDWHRVSSATTQICADVPKSVATPRTGYWFRLQKIVGNSSPSVVWDSPRQQANQNIDNYGPNQTDEGFVIQSSFNPTPIGGKAQLCTTVTLQNSCR